jgi:hypothetical protein
MARPPTLGGPPPTAWAAGGRDGGPAGDDRPHHGAPVPAGRQEAMGWLRAPVGAALLTAPAVPRRLSGSDGATGTSVPLLRTIGTRDLVLGLGTVPAARSGDRAAARRSTATALSSDAPDVVARLAGAGSIGRKQSVGGAPWRSPSRGATPGRADASRPRIVGDPRHSCAVAARQPSVDATARGMGRLGGRAASRIAAAARPAAPRSPRTRRDATIDRRPSTLPPRASPNS